MTFLSFRLVCCALFLSLFNSGRAQLGTPCGLGPAGFGYDSNSPIGPDNWQFLNGFEDCGSEEAQSPINVPEDVEVESRSKNPTLNLKRKTELKFECTNFNFELKCENVGDCGSTTFKGIKYDVANQHFHAPSEHTLEGQQYPLEAHTVHVLSNGDFLVIATFFKIGSQNEEFQNILEEIAGGVEEFEVNLKKLVNADKCFCAYMGSLTTPPCTETVTWLINLDIQTVSASQVAEFIDRAGSAPFGNNRPLQPLNDREVTCFVEKDDDDDSDDDSDSSDDDSDDSDDDNGH